MNGCFCFLLGGRGGPFECRQKEGGGGVGYLFALLVGLAFEHGGTHLGATGTRLVGLGREEVGGWEGGWVGLTLIE